MDRHADELEQLDRAVGRCLHSNADNTDNYARASSAQVLVPREISYKIPFIVLQIVVVASANTKMFIFFSCYAIALVESYYFADCNLNDMQTYSSFYVLKRTRSLFHRISVTMFPYIREKL